MENKQTAVIWLQESLQNHLSFEQKMQFEGLFQQAIEMEKEQIIKAIEDWYTFDFESAEQYYNELYNK